MGERMIFSINGAGKPGCPYAEREEGQGESEGKKKRGSGRGIPWHIHTMCKD